MSEGGAAPGGRLRDAPSRNLVDGLAPEAAKPFLKLARIDRPIGWWLLLLPCWWSAALAAIAGGRPWPAPWHMLLFFIGAVAMRGAGSTWNDLVDRDLDARVERTRGRPLPSGAVTARAAAAFLAAQALVGLAVLLQFNRFTVFLGLLSLLPVAIYPLMKRITFFPQGVLGLAFAYGGLMGWAAAFGSLAWPALALYGAAIAWTIGYDTVYALQDIEDDEIVGIGSSARLFGPRVREAVAAFYALAVALLIAAIFGAGGGPAAYAGAALFALHLAWQVRSIVPGDPANALALFRSNRTAGLMLTAALIADAAIGAAALR